MAQKSLITLTKHQNEVLRILYSAGVIFLFDDHTVGLDDFDGNSLPFRRATFDKLLEHRFIYKSMSPNLGTDLYSITDAGIAHLGIKLTPISDWIMVSETAAVRVLENTNCMDQKNRVAKIDNTAHVRIKGHDDSSDYDLKENWQHVCNSNTERGLDEEARDECDQRLRELGYIF